MVRVTDKNYEMDAGLVSQNEYIKNLVEDDFDGWICLDGEIEGVGKSTLGAQIAYYLDPSFCVDRIVFTVEEFKEAVNKAQQRQAIMWDEASEGTNSKEGNSALNAALQRFSEQIRQKNLFIILIRPHIFDLAKYFAIARTWYLVTVGIHANEKTKRFERGQFSFYNRMRKRLLYLRGKKEYDRFKVAPNFTGKFTNFFPVDYEAYKQKKSIIRERKKREGSVSTGQVMNALLAWGNSPALLCEIVYDGRKVTRQALQDRKTKLVLSGVIDKQESQNSSDYLSGFGMFRKKKVPIHIEDNSSAEEEIQ